MTQLPYVMNEIPLHITDMKAFGKACKSMGVSASRLSARYLANVLRGHGCKCHVRGNKIRVQLAK